MRKIAIEFFSNHGSIPTTNKNNHGSIAIEHLGLFADVGRGGSGGAVSSVNNKTGNVVLNADDVGADNTGSAQAVSDALQPQITTNTDALAMLTALLSALQASKADLAYVNDQIANLVNSDAQTLATIQAITDALAENEDLLEALDQTVANRVRFDVATQGLTALQKYNARTNIGAEEVGTAAMLISQITAASIGAITASQLATVATTGSYNDLTNKPNITGTLLAGLTTVAASAISATDSIIGALAKLQASVDTKADAVNTLLLLGNKQNKLPTTGTAGQFLAHDMTFKTPVIWVKATDACSYIHPSILSSAVNLYFAKINGFLAMRGTLAAGGTINAGERLFQMNAGFCIYQGQPNDAANSGDFGGKYGYRNAMTLSNRFEIYPNILSGAANQTALFTNLKLYGYYDPIYVSDPCLGMLVTP